jgi:hypothetical protein
MPIVNYGNHTIEVINTFWGNEIVKYDGKTMIKGYSAFGRSYHFIVSEDNQQITYEVEFKAGFLGVHFNVRRNGVSIFSS